MKTNIVIDISPPIPDLAKFWFSSCAPKNSFWHADKHQKFFTSWYYHFRCVWPSLPKVSNIRSLLIFAISPEKHGRRSCFFCRQINTKFFYKFFSNWYFHFSAANHAQITLTNKFAVSLQYLMKEVSDEVYFLHPEEHEGLPQINIMILIKVPEVGSLQYFYNISDKKLEMKFIFCMQVNIKVCTSWHYYFL